jgi:hypothetical protein
MRELDKKFYKALIFFDRYSKDELNKIKINDPRNYEENVPKNIENDLFNLEYIDPSGTREYVLMPKGQEELRKLDEVNANEEQMKVNKWAIIISSFAIILAIISLLIDYSSAMGWI